MEKQYFTINLDHSDDQESGENAGLRRVSKARDTEAGEKTVRRSRPERSSGQMRRERPSEEDRADRFERAERAAKARALRNGEDAEQRPARKKKKKSALKKRRWGMSPADKRRKERARRERELQRQQEKEAKLERKAARKRQAETEVDLEEEVSVSKIKKPGMQSTVRRTERITPEERARLAAERQASKAQKAEKRQKNREKASAGFAGVLQKLKGTNPKTAMIIGIVIAVLVLGTVGGIAIKNMVQNAKEKARQEQILKEQEEARIAAEQAAAEAKAAEEAYLKVPEDYVFAPTCTPNTEPGKLISETLLQVNGDEMAPSQYTSDTTFNFPAGKDYTNAEGIITFRGNNFRSDPTYGTAKMENKKLNKAWTVNTGGLDSWTGSGWTGQPLIVKWPDAIKQHSNMYESAKNKADLVEVIYACMDGYIYFIDLDTGEATRDSMYLGYTFKGAGALDPRGYPIMYLGAGINSSQYGTAHAFIINLLDCSVMYEFGCEDEFSLRGSLSFFDSSALVCAENDTLIYPGENGILYLIHLNSNYDEAAGTVSINPDKTVKWRYDGYRCSSDTFWWGMEDSAVIYSHYLFVADNAGFFMCLDLNTLQLVWVQDVLDDTNDTPVFEFENGHPYLYISTSFHDGWRAYGTVEIPIWKIDAENGEIVWQTSYECNTIEGVSGGVQSTIALGRNKLKDNIYVTVSMVGSQSDGVCVALNKETGEKVFEHNAAYAWSSPACVYDEEGNGNVLYCASNGKVYLLDGLTGEQYDMLDLGEGTIEASPAIYNNTAVVGTRDCLIFGIELE